MKAYLNDAYVATLDDAGKIAVTLCSTREAARELVGLVRGHGYVRVNAGYAHGRSTCQIAEHLRDVWSDRLRALRAFNRLAVDLSCPVADAGTILAACADAELSGVYA